MTSVGKTKAKRKEPAGREASGTSARADLPVGMTGAIEIDKHEWKIVISP
jgi:hypothetical protein